MSNYTLVSRPTSNQSPRSNFGASSKPTGITIHWWGSPAAGATHAGVVSWLRGPAGGTNNRNSSAHYVVSGKRVSRLAADTRATWHSGNRIGNGTTIGIEVHPRNTATTWDTLVELCADIEERHGSMKYYRHLDWKATACPGVYSRLIARLVNDVNAEHRRRRGGGSTRPASSSSSSSSSSTTYRQRRTTQDDVAIHSHRDSSGDRQVGTASTAGYALNVVEDPVGSWTRVRWNYGSNAKPDYRNAWVASASLNPFYEDQRTSNGTAIVDFLSRSSEDKVPVFAGTGRDAKEIGMMHNAGYRVRVTGMKGTTGSWSRIRWDGSTGWVHTNKLERA